MHDQIRADWVTDWHHVVMAVLALMVCRMVPVSNRRSMLRDLNDD